MQRTFDAAGRDLHRRDQPGTVPPQGGYDDAERGDVMMTLFTKTAEPKLLPACTMPLTGVGGVSRVYSDYATIEVGPRGARIVETWGLGAAELDQQLGLV